MCRWLGYCGGPIRVERLLFEPGHSLIDQSLSARSGPSTTNGDGFGLADGEPLAALARMAALVERLGHDAGVEHPLQMTLGVGDGERLYAVRYSSEASSRTLHVSRGVDDLRALDPCMEGVTEDSRVVVSEPFTDVPEHWDAVGESTAIVVEAGEVESFAFVPIDAG